MSVVKKVVVVWSSPNVSGLTATAKDNFIKGIEREGATVQKIHLNKCKIEHCKACGNGWGSCRANGKCFMNDDFQSVYDALVAADGIVFVSAVYWSDLTEQFKAFIDRLRRCEATANHFLANKRCVLVACAGGTGRGTIECLGNMELALTHMGMRAYDRIPVNRYNAPYIIPALEEAGATYVERLNNGFDMYY